MAIRAPDGANNQLTNRALNEPEGSAFAQKCILKFSFLSWNKLDSPKKNIPCPSYGSFSGGREFF